MEDVQARTLIQGGVGSLSVRPRTPGTSAYEMSTELVLRLARVEIGMSASQRLIFKSRCQLSLTGLFADLANSANEPSKSQSPAAT